MTGGIDLDRRYPAEVEFWSRYGGVDDANGGGAALEAHWLQALRNGERKIARSIHQTWKDANPPHALFSPRWRKSMRRANPGWSYRLWTDAENRELIRTRYPWFLPTYDAYPTPIQRADVARYLIAHHHGGVYADLDTECFSPFAPLMHHDRNRGGDGESDGESEGGGGRRRQHDQQLRTCGTDCR